MNCSGVAVVVWCKRVVGFRGCRHYIVFSPSVSCGVKTPDFQVGMNFFMTPDGNDARIVMYHTGEAQSPEGIKQIQAVTAAAQEAVKGTSLSNARIYLAGAASNYRDVQDYSRNDIIIIMMLATFALVFTIVLLITRALVGAIIVLITVILSFAGAHGLSVFIWETLLRTQLHWQIGRAHV